MSHNNNDAKQIAVEAEENSKSKEEAENEFRKQVTSKASANIMKAFLPIRIIAYIFGRFPFQTVKKPNGVIAFTFKKLTFPAIYFCITSITSTIIFVMLCIGYISMFFEVNVSKQKNKCSATWENVNLNKTSVPTALTVSLLYLTVAGSVILLFRGKVYLHYLNYWNKAISVLQLDPSEGARRSAIIDNVQCLVLIIVFTACYASKFVLSVQEGAASIANALVRLFIQDIGINSEFNKAIAEDSDCTMRKNGKVYNTLDYDVMSFTLLKLVGFLVQSYAFYGSLCLIIQFRFFCKLLRNTAFVWNERFQNALHGKKEDINDQNKRRLSLKFLMKDHLIMVQMFKLTEAAFAHVLISFFAVQILNMFCELYFLSALKGMSSCEILFGSLRGEQQIIMKACLKIDADADITWMLSGKSTDQWFSDPCSSTQSKIAQEAVVSIILLIQTIRITFSITFDASLAYEEAMRGFQILRRHSYMHCKSRRERNFMHSLIFSFAASNNPVHITAGKYFVVNKALLLIITGTICTYYVILLQFKPGLFDTKDYCIDLICKKIFDYKQYGHQLEVECAKFNSTFK